MSCKDAMLTKVPTLTATKTVADAIALFEKDGVSYAPVLDKGKMLLGVISLRRLLKNLMPVSVETESGVRVPLPAAPGFDKRLERARSLKIAELMDSRYHAISPEAPLLEGIRVLLEDKEPVPVVDGEGKFLGLLTEEAAFSAVQKKGR